MARSITYKDDTRSGRLALGVGGRSSEEGQAGRFLLALGETGAGGGNAGRRSHHLDGLSSCAGSQSSFSFCLPPIHFANSISLGRQVLFSHGSNGPYMRRITNQLLPGMVCSQLSSLPVGAFGEK